MIKQSFISVDIETTGLSPIKDRIIEIGAVKVVNGEIVDTFDLLVDPQVELSERIIALTGITDDMLKGKPSIEEVLQAFMEFNENLPLLGHNILFDYSFLKTAASKQKQSYERSGIDTLYLSRMLHPELESKSLEAMCQYYHIINENHHRAYEDALATMRLYECLAKHEKALPESFAAKPLMYRVKKIEPAMPRQKKLLNDLIKYHKIEVRQSVDTMTKSEASRLVDMIFANYGRIPN